MWHLKVIRKYGNKNCFSYKLIRMMFEWFLAKLPFCITPSSIEGCFEGHPSIALEIILVWWSSFLVLEFSWNDEWLLRSVHSKSDRTLPWSFPSPSSFSSTPFAVLWSSALMGSTVSLSAYWTGSWPTAALASWWSTFSFVSSSFSWASSSLSARLPSSSSMIRWVSGSSILLVNQHKQQAPLFLLRFHLQPLQV